MELPTIEPKDFIHLHNHIASYDSLGSIKYNIQAIKKLGFNRFASTEHGTLASVIQILSYGKYYGISPIIGLEPYIYDDELDKVFHITLLAKNLEGYYSLVKLNNIAKLNARGKRKNDSVISINDLIKHNSNLYLLSGCFNSPLQTNTYNEYLAKQLQNSFEDRMYAEAQVLHDTKHLERAIKISEHLNIPIVVTNDCHYVNKEHSKFHRTYIEKVNGFGYDSSLNYFATPDEIISRVDSDELKSIVRQGILNTNLLEFEDYSVLDKQTLPHIENSETIIVQKCKQAIVDKNLDNDTYNDRLQKELKVINEQDLSTYFLIVEDILSYGRSIGAKIGYGRGSGVGSLVCYLLGITQIDPIEHSLIFERFINAKRKELPDIDSDSDPQHREAILQYAAEKYSAVQIATYGTWGNKNTFNKFGHCFEKITDEDRDKFKEGLTEDDEDDDEYVSLGDKYPEYNEFANIIYGQTSSIGTHAGGIAPIPPDKLDKVPYEISADNKLLLAYTEGKNKDLGESGIVKIDLLGLKALAILKMLEKITNVKPPTPEDSSSPVYSLFREGKTKGIFQFSGDKIMEFTKQCNVQSFADLVAITAVYRAGTLRAGTGELYKKVKSSNKPRKIYPDVDNILADTDGLIIYQEDVMKIYAWATDCTFEEADFARKTLVKYKPDNPKSVEAVNILKQKMFEGMKNKNVPDKIAKELFKEIVTHSEYSFNKSHAVAYTYISWELAWYKYHYPLEYNAACLTYRDSAEWQNYIYDVQREGYKIALPDINLSSPSDIWTNDATKLYMPLESIKGIASSLSSAIALNRPFNSISDLMVKIPRRILNSSRLKALYDVGALDSLIKDDQDVWSLNLKDYNKLPLENYFSVRVLSDEQLKEIDRVNNITSNEYKYYSGIVTKVIPNDEKHYTTIILTPYNKFSVQSTDTNLKHIVVGGVYNFAINANGYKKYIQKMIKI